jgi:antitoxin (DNA-binding transcriptional repressor) of toxin-antitoxin stability system
MMRRMKRMPKVGDSVLVPAIIVRVNGGLARVHIGSELMPTAITVPVASLVPGNRRKGMDDLTSAIRAYHNRQEASPNA